MLRPPDLVLARHAMATRFEIAMYGDDPVALRAAGEEALDEIERLESQLSLYRPSSELSRLNARAALGPVRVEGSLFQLLRRAQDLTRRTGGAFDITVGPLLRCWGFVGGTGALPGDEELAQARASSGMSLVELDLAALTVRFRRPGVMMDLGSFGKGFAIDRAVAILREAGVSSALIHGGTSTSYGIGTPPGETAWRVAIDPPQLAQLTSGAPHHEPPASGPMIAVVELKDSSLSVSAVWGKSFHQGERTYGHVIDPRSGRPASSAWLAAAVAASGADTDALSTALLVLGPDEAIQLCAAEADLRALVVSQAADPPGYRVWRNGLTAAASGAPDGAPTG